MQSRTEMVDDQDKQRTWETWKMVHTEFLIARVRASLGRTERGASLVEYALLLALIAVVCIVSITVLGNNLSQNYDENNTSIFGA